MAPRARRTRTIAGPEEEDDAAPPPPQRRRTGEAGELPLGGRVEDVAERRPDDAATIKATLKARATDFSQAVLPYVGDSALRVEDGDATESVLASEHVAAGLSLMDQTLNLCHWRGALRAGFEDHPLMTHPANTIARLLGVNRDGGAVYSEPATEENQFQGLLVLQQTVQMEAQKSLLTEIRALRAEVRELKDLVGGAGGAAAQRGAADPAGRAFGFEAGQSSIVRSIHGICKDIIGRTQLLQWMPVCAIAETKLERYALSVDVVIASVEVMSIIESFGITSLNGTSSMSFPRFLHEIRNKRFTKVTDSLKYAVDALYGKLVNEGDTPDMVAVRLDGTRAQAMRATVLLTDSDFATARAKLTRAAFCIVLLALSDMKQLPKQSVLPASLVDQRLTWENLCDDKLESLKALSDADIVAAIQGAELISPALLGLGAYTIAVRSGVLNRADLGFKLNEKSGKRHRGYYLAYVAKFSDWFPNQDAGEADPFATLEENLVTPLDYATFGLGGRTVEPVDLPNGVGDGD